MGPLCKKLETFLRLAKVACRCGVGDLRKAPRGQMPYARIDGVTIGDSDCIIDRIAQHAGADLYVGRTAEKRAADRALARMLEESTVWVLRHSRFVDEGYDDLQHFMNAILPMGIKHIVRPMIRRNMRQALVGQGLGRSSRAAI